MTYRDVYEKAVSIIGQENIEDYRPHGYEDPESCTNAVTIWLNNGDIIIYKVEDK